MGRIDVIYDTGMRCWEFFLSASAPYIYGCAEDDSKEYRINLNLSRAGRNVNFLFAEYEYLRIEDLYCAKEKFIVGCCKGAKNGAREALPYFRECVRMGEEPYKAFSELFLLVMKFGDYQAFDIDDCAKDEQACRTLMQEKAVPYGAHEKQNLSAKEAKRINLEIIKEIQEIRSYHSTKKGKEILEERERLLAEKRWEVEQRDCQQMIKDVRRLLYMIEPDKIDKENERTQKHLDGMDYLIKELQKMNAEYNFLYRIFHKKK